MFIKTIRLTLLTVFLVTISVSMLFAQDVTVTNSNSYRPYTSKNSWTATTGVDSALCLGRDNNPVFIADLPEGSRQLSAQLETAETTAASVDKIFVWFISNQPSPVESIASGPTFSGDWTEAKRDTFTNTLTPISYFDVSSYSGLFVCVMVYESAGNTAVAESCYIYSPTRRNEALEIYPN